MVRGMPLKMKRYRIFGAAALICFLCAGTGHAQKNKQQATTYSDKLPKRHVARFDQNLHVGTAAQDSLKQKVARYVDALRFTIDTLDITERRRQRLLAAIKKNPYSEKLEKVHLIIESHRAQARGSASISNDQKTP
ncbi:hypothetical protein VC82_2842 [Flagellimonas lutaonensis]|uniref:Uncharacterized protein n=2 Tax=Flagellimonas lutaonensis TaxID=516051 RepID=A0A0D5YX09_9FLAO|nr:hypothetical protein VC82_2842 [Allomuricauda lutaonensis]